MNYLGYSFADRGIRLDEAEKLLRQAVALEPENGAFLDSLGWLRFKQGESRDAVKILEAAAQRAPDVLIFDHLAQAYVSVHEHAKAADMWTRALTLDPKNAALRKKRDEAARQSAAGSDQRGTLKRIEENFRQVMNARGAIALNGRWQGRSGKARGHLTFLRPRQLVFELNGWGPAPAVRLFLEDDRLRIEPENAAQAAPALSRESLQLLADFFSGELVASFDRPELKIEKTEKEVRFTLPDGRFLAVSATQGLIVAMKMPNASGGTDTVTISEYALEDGLWLPKRMRWENAGQAWNAGLTFSKWALNDPANEQVLTPSK